MNLPDKLIYFRKQKGLTQSNLAEALNVSRQAVSRWEVGTAVPSTDNLKVLSNLYGVSVDYLLDDKADDVCKDSGNYSLCQEDAGKKTAISPKEILTGLLIAVVVTFVVLLSALIGSWGRTEPTNILPFEEMDTEAEDNYQAETFLLE